MFTEKNQAAWGSGTYNAPKTEALKAIAEVWDANAVIDVRYPSAASTALNSVLKGHEGVYRWCAVLAGYNFAGTFLLFPLYGQFE